MSGVTVDRAARRHARTRAEILDAAWRLAERDGIAGLSLRDLAREIGMRAPSLYTYFDGKGAIYDAMFAQGYAQLDAELADLEPDPADPHGSLTRAVQRWLGFCQASVARYQLMFTRALPGWQPSPEAYEASLASYDRMAASLAPLGIRGPDALDLFTALVGGLAAQQLANDPGGDRWVRLAPHATRMLLTHLDRSAP